MDSLFTSIPLGETIDFIFDKIYVRKKLEPFRKKSVFKKLINKLCKGCTFLADGKLIRQVDGFPMGGPISVVFSNIFCVKMEFDVAKPLYPKLYKRYVDDIFSKRIKNQLDMLFQKLNNYHPNIKLTIKVNPSKFLDTEIMIKNDIIETSVVVQESKIPNHWSSIVSKKYKRNAILGDLHRAHKISSNFELEKQRMKKKYLSVNFTYSFIQSTFNSYQQKCESLIPNWLFEEKHRKTIYIRIPFCQSNEHYALKIIRKLENFTKEKYSFVIIWKTRNIRSLFNLKDKTSQIASRVYEGKCNCGENYIGETGRNVTIRWDEHSDIDKNSESAKHIKQFPEHRFNWKILRRVPNKVRKRKIHEAYYVMCLRPTLNNQLGLTSLTLFRNGVT